MFSHLKCCFPYNALLVDAFQRNAVKLIWDTVLSFCSSTRRRLVIFFTDIFKVFARKIRSLKCHIFLPEDQTRGLSHMYLSAVQFQKSRISQFCLLLIYPLWNLFLHLETYTPLTIVLADFRPAPYVSAWASCSQGVLYNKNMKPLLSEICYHRAMFLTIFSYYI